MSDQDDPTDPTPAELAALRAETDRLVADEKALFHAPPGTTGSLKLQQLLREARQLSPEQRQELAYALLESLER